MVKNGHMFWTSTGLAYCASCETGEALYKERLPAEEVAANGEGGGRRRPTGDYASAIAIGDNVLLTTRSGTTHILKAEASFQPVAENSV